MEKEKKKVYIFTKYDFHDLNEKKGIKGRVTIVLIWICDKIRSKSMEKTNNDNQLHFLSCILTTMVEMVMVVVLVVEVVLVVVVVVMVVEVVVVTVVVVVEGSRSHCSCLYLIVPRGPGVIKLKPKLPGQTGKVLARKGRVSLAVKGKLDDNRYT